MNIIDKGKELCKDAATYWKTPPKGRYMTYKEIFSLAIGGFGAKFVIWCSGQLLIGVGNAFVCNTVGIGPMPVYVIWLLSTLSGFPLTALRAKMIDNARGMKGKYRPYILSMGLPTIIITIAYVLFPYEHMANFVNYAFLLLCNIGFQFFYNFYNDAYTSIINVLSPNTIERADIISIRDVVANLAPSVCGIFMPIAARLITGENTLYDIRVYRVLFPIVAIVGFAISMFIYVNTEEKIVQAKSHIVQIKFMDALRAVVGNKYFWIISLAGWIGFLEGSAGSIIGWMYNYQHVCSPAQYSIIVAITGNASLWSMLIAPYCTRRFGKRKVLIVTNVLNIMFFTCMIPVVHNTDANGIIWILVLCIFANNLITTLSNLLITGINADVRDYQQYITGERIDGMFAAVGLIGTVITLATSFVLPMIYDMAGLNETVAISLGFDGKNIYDVLYDPGYFSKVSSTLVIASIIGATLNVIPYFFYDLTETRQKGIVSVLKIRAMFEDYGNHILQADKMEEAVEIIKEAQTYCNREPKFVSKAEIRRAHCNEPRSAVRKAYKEAIEENEKIEVAKFVMQELNRFNTPEGQADVSLARSIADAGLNGFLNIELESRAKVKAMPHKTPEERERRRSILNLIEKMKLAEKNVKKYFPNGIQVFDNSVLEELFKAEDAQEQQIHDTLQAIKRAKTEKNAGAVAELKSKLKSQRVNLRQIHNQVNQASKEYTLYYRAVQPYIDAQKLLTQQENYTHLDDILAQAETQNVEITV